MREEKVVVGPLSRIIGGIVVLEPTPGIAKYFFGGLLNFNAGRVALKGVGEFQGEGLQPSIDPFAVRGR